MKLLKFIIKSIIIFVFLLILIGIFYGGCSLEDDITKYKLSLIQQQNNSYTPSAQIPIEILQPEEPEDLQSTELNNNEKENISYDLNQLQIEIYLSSLIIKSAYNPYLMLKFNNGFDTTKYNISDDTDLKTFIKQVKEAKERLLHIYYTAKDKNIQRDASIALITSLKTIADPDYYRIAKDALEYVYNFCTDFMSCQILINDLSLLNNIVPDLVLTKYEEIRNEISQKISHKFQSQILYYLIDSNVAIANFYNKSGIYLFDFFAKPSMLDSSTIQTLRKSFNTLMKNELIIKLIQSNWDIDTFTKYLILPNDTSVTFGDLNENLEILIQQIIIPTLGPEEYQNTQKLAYALIQNIFFIYQTNIAYDLYLWRTQFKSPKLLINLLNANLLSNKDERAINLITAILTLHIFLEYEIKLPYRTEWVDLLLKYCDIYLKEHNNTQISQDTNTTYLTQDKIITEEYIESLKSFAQEQLNLYNEWILKFLTDNKFEGFLDIQDQAYDINQKEQWAFENIPLFYSLLNQEINIDKANLEIGPVLLKYWDQNTLLVQQSLIDEIQEKIENVVLPAFLKTACYSYIIPKTKKEHDLYEKIKNNNYQNIIQFFKEKSYSKYIFPYTGQELDLSQICGYDPSKIENSIINYLRYSVDKKFKNQIAFEIGLTIAQIPLTIASASIAGTLSRPAAQITKNLLTRQAKTLSIIYLKNVMYRALIRQTMFFMAKKAIPHLVQAMIGASAFVITQKAFSGIISSIMQRRPQALYEQFYEQKTYIDKNGKIQQLDFWPNLWANYGKEILMGTTIFMILPLIQTYTRNLGAKWAQLDNLQQAQIYKIYQRLTISQEAKIAITQTTTDGLVFGSLPMIDRTINATFSPNNHDPIWQGSKTFTKELAEGVLISLAFKTAEDYSIYRLRTKFPSVNLIKLTNPEFINSNGQIINAYKIFGLRYGASEQEIKQSYNLYRQLCLKYHPDRIHNMSAEFQIQAKNKYDEIQKAFKILNNPELKKEYDALMLRSRGWLGDINYIITKIIKIITSKSSDVSTNSSFNKNTKQNIKPKIYLLPYDPNINK